MELIAKVKEDVGMGYVRWGGLSLTQLLREEWLELLGTRAVGVVEDRV